MPSATHKLGPAIPLAELLTGTPIAKVVHNTTN